MLFTTLTYFLFLPLVWAIYWALRDRRWQNHFIIVASYFFYGWWDWRYCGLMLLSSVVDFGLGLAMESAPRRPARRWLLAASLGFNLGLLGFFKYFNFFADNLTGIGSLLGIELDTPRLRILLPVGISFYTFQSLSYTIEVYRGNLKATRSLSDFMAFVSFFPQLVAGPIERSTHMLPQFQRDRSFDPEAARDGCRQILWGLFKKMAVAENLAVIVNAAYARPATTPGLQLAFATVCFAFQIYCDFSAYSDIAIGSARLFGIELMQNFRRPYISRDPAEFWRRWHISLSTWFRDYLYIPLGGNRVSPARRHFNILATFTISGLWHGASWNFIIWGALNGLAILPFSGERRREVAHRSFGGLVRIGATFVFICATWVFFRATTLADAGLIFARILDPLIHPSALGEWLHIGGARPALRALCLIGLVLAAEFFQGERAHPIPALPWPLPLRWAFYSAVFWGALYMTPEQQGQFIYFQF